MERRGRGFDLSPGAPPSRVPPRSHIALSLTIVRGSRGEDVVETWRRACSPAMTSRRGKIHLTRTSQPRDPFHPGVVAHTHRNTLCAWIFSLQECHHGSVDAEHGSSIENPVSTRRRNGNQNVCVRGLGRWRRSAGDAECQVDILEGYREFLRPDPIDWNRAVVVSPRSKSARAGHLSGTRCALQHAHRQSVPR